MVFKKSLWLFLVFSMILSSSQHVYAGYVADKMLTLGLDVVSATADKQSMDKGAVAAMKKTSFDWIWEYVGGVEKIAFNSSTSDLVDMRTKITFIVDTIKKVQLIGTQLGEGSYDEAAITAIDIAVNKINHPALGAVWSAIKATYASQKLLADTKAALEIEMLYSIVNKDRRLIGEATDDGPVLIDIDSETVDYFFNDYLVTNPTVRGYVKNYVEKELGEQWPEQSWSDYFSSFRAIGSGVDQEAAAEIEALTTEFRNTARHWINALLEDLNDQVQVAYDQMRLRREMVEYDHFAKSVGDFYDNDFERMWKEFQNMKQMKEDIPKYKALLAQATKEYPIYNKKLNNPKKSELLKEVGSIQGYTFSMQLKLLKASGSAGYVNQKALGTQLNSMRNKWVSLSERATEIIDFAVGEDSGVDDSGVYYDKPTKNHWRILRFSEFTSTLEPFKWSGSATVKVEKRTMIDEDSKLGWDSRNVKREMIPKNFLIDVGDSVFNDVMKALNEGDFKKASEKMPYFSGISIAIGKHYGDMNKKLLVDSGVVPAQYADQAGRFIGQKFNDISLSSSSETGGLYLGISDVPAPDNSFWKSGSNAQIFNRLWEAFTVLKGKDFAYLNSRQNKFSRAVSAFDSLRKSAEKRYALYKSTVSYAVKNLPMDRPPNIVGMKVEPKEAYIAIKPFDNYDTTVEYVPKILKSESDKLFNKANRMSGNHAQGIRAYVKKYEFQWKDAKEAWEKMSKLTPSEIKAIEVLVLRGSLDVTAQAKLIDKAVQNSSTYLSKMQSVLTTAVQVDQREKTIGDNMFKDAAFLSMKAVETEGFAEKLLASDLITQKAHQRTLTPNLTIDDSGMALANDLPRRYLTSAELNLMKTEIRGLVTSAPAYTFIRTYFKSVAKHLEDLMNFDGIVPAKEKNFFAPVYGKPYYESDLRKAFEKVSKLKSSSSSYDATMQKVAELLPGLMQIHSKLDEKYDQEQANLYRMTLAEYYEKMPTRAPKNRYFLRTRVDGILDSEELQQFDLGKLYIDIAKRIKELSLEHKGDAIRSRQEAHRKEQEEEIALRLEEENKKAEKKSKAMIDAMGDFELAGFYGYSIENPRLNSRSIPEARGDVVITKGDLISGKISVEARLFANGKAKTILLSKDGGRTWEKLGLSKDIKFAFSPRPNQTYDFILKVKTTDKREPWIRIFNSVNSFVYKDVSFEQLIAQAITDIANAYERSDSSSFSDRISRNYLGNKAMLEEGVRFDFDMFTNIRLKIYINRIEERRGLFVAETKWDKTQNPRTTGQEQQTSGRTTFIFVLEDGKMKIKNLRGDLIYATLSPEIAQASGKNSTVIDKIKTARNDRNPIQPGAGTTEDDGGGTASSSSSVILNVSTSPVMNTTSNPGFDFTANAKVAGIGGSPNSDLDLESNIMFGTSGMQKITGNTFASLTAAPISGYSSGGTFIGSPGTVYTFITTEGYYGKMQILSFAGGGGGNLRLKFAVQTDGSKNLNTQ